MEVNPRILLIQAREAGDPMAEHERNAFAGRSELPLECFSTFNIALQPAAEFSPEGFDALMVGGSGAFSLVEGGFHWHEDFLAMTRQILSSGIPMFASCFGFQAIVQALGGALAKDPDRAELGTYAVTLTEAGKADPLFGDLPQVFDAQFGHNDSAIRLTDDLIHLASTERCFYQAIRVKDRPVVATQFHPELNRSGNLDRFRNYLKNYKQPEHSFEEAMAHAESIHRETPHACGLLHSFVADLRVRRRTVKIAAE